MVEGGLGGRSLIDVSTVEALNWVQECGCGVKEENEGASTVP